MAEFIDDDDNVDLIKELLEEKEVLLPEDDDMDQIMVSIQDDVVVAKWYRIYKTTRNTHNKLDKIKIKISSLQINIRLDNVAVWI